MRKLDLVIGELYEEVEQLHGGCYDEECSLNTAMELYDVPLAINIWYHSGAATDSFSKLYKKNKRAIEKKLK